MSASLFESTPRGFQLGFFDPPEEITGLRPLRPRQEAAIEQIRHAIAEGHRRIMLQSPTGWGKTLTAAHIIESALQKGSRPLFTCPAITLVDQTLRAFEAEGIRDIGIIQAQHARTDHRAAVQIASVQTLIRRAIPEVTFMLIDEAHEIYDGLNSLMDSPEWKDKVVIGLSATPWVRGMGLRWTKLVVGATMRDMITEGYAREFTIYGPPKDIDREALAISKGDFEESSASAVMSDKTIVGDVLQEWKERSTHQKTFAFCVNRDHAKAQIDAFTDAGIPFGYIDANVPMGVSDADRGTRKHIFAQMRHGEIAGIASVGCLIRGVDEVVYNILDLQPTKSEIRHCQKWGRMRTGDPDATYLGFDHAGNNQNLGTFWDIHHDTLDTRQPGEREEAYKEDYKAAKPRKCQKCHTLVPPGARTCPTCMERLPLHTGVTVKDGRLVELKPKPKPTKEQQAWFSELIWLGKKAGFKEAWTAMQFKEKFGVMPFELADMKTRGKRPTPEVSKFVRDRLKEYKAKKSGGQNAAKIEAIEMSA